MTKLIRLFSTLLMMGSIVLQAQQPKSSASGGKAFEENHVYISGGYGLGNLGLAIFRDLGSVLSAKAVGPLHAKVEYAITDHVGLAVHYAYGTAELKTIDEKVDVLVNNVPDKLRWSATWNTYHILVRLNTHFGAHEKLDPFWGFGLGLRNWNYHAVSNDGRVSEVNSVFPVGFETTFGLRYFPIERLGVYTELGIGKSLIQFGITGKI